ncbi:MAG: methionyl-tRNA formyltransferase [Proteobacteria bacterium]|nr:MAG: methionyl-tRNA formyltransferase [Pseudomonadota bacterium]
MRIVFMGTPAYATRILEGLLRDDSFEIVGLFTQADKPVGRKKILTPPHIKDFVLKSGYEIPIFQPKNLRGDGIEEQMRDLKPDFIVVAAYGQILPKNILDLCPCINLHASILPKYRGASPIQSAILANEKQTGVTSMLMDEGLDTGDILGFSYVDLDDEVTSLNLFDELSDMARDLSVKTLKNFENILALPQNDTNSSKCSKISKKDGKVDILSQSAFEIYTKFRAFTPWPGIFLESGLKLINVKLKDKASKKEPGEILAINKDETQIACKEGILSIFEVQPPTKQKMSAYSYMQGLRKRVGDKLY